MNAVPQRKNHKRHPEIHGVLATVVVTETEGTVIEGEVGHMSVKRGVVAGHVTRKEEVEADHMIEKEKIEEAAVDHMIEKGEIEVDLVIEKEGAEVDHVTKKGGVDHVNIKNLEMQEVVADHVKENEVLQEKSINLKLRSVQLIKKLQRMVYP